MYYLLSELKENLIYTTDSIRKKYYAAIFHGKKSIDITEEEQLEFLKNIEKEINPIKNIDLDNLIILYRKTNQKEKEMQAIEWLIEEEQNKQYNRKEFLKIKFPEDIDSIQKCYEENITYINPFGDPINFFTKINRLNRRLQKLNKP